MSNTYYGDKHMVGRQSDHSWLIIDWTKAQIDTIVIVSIATINLYNKTLQLSGLQCQTFILMLMDLHSWAEMNGLQVVSRAWLQAGCFRSAHM